MNRTITNDVLAVRAKDKASAAKPDSRERTLWNTVARALDSTMTAEAARTMLLGLAMPALRQDSARMLGRLVAGMKDDEKDD